MKAAINLGPHAFIEENDQIEAIDVVKLLGKSRLEDLQALIDFMWRFFAGDLVLRDVHRSPKQLRRSLFDILRHEWRPLKEAASPLSELFDPKFDGMRPFLDSEKKMTEMLLESAGRTSHKLDLAESLAWISEGPRWTRQPELTSGNIEVEISNSDFLFKSIRIGSFLRGVNPKALKNDSAELARTLFQTEKNFFENRGALHYLVSPESREQWERMKVQLPQISRSAWEVVDVGMNGSSLSLWNSRALKFVQPMLLESRPVLTPFDEILQEVALQGAPEEVFWKWPDLAANIDVPAVSFSEWKVWTRDLVGKDPDRRVIIPFSTNRAKINTNSRVRVAKRERVEPRWALRVRAPMVFSRILLDSVIKKIPLNKCYFLWDDSVPHGSLLIVYKGRRKTVPSILLKLQNQMLPLLHKGSIWELNIGPHYRTPLLFGNANVYRQLETRWLLELQLLRAVGTPITNPSFKIERRRELLRAILMRALETYFHDPRDLAAWYESFLEPLEDQRQIELHNKIKIWSQVSGINLKDLKFKNFSALLEFFQTHEKVTRTWDSETKNRALSNLVGGALERILPGVDLIDLKAIAKMRIDEHKS